MAKSTSKPSSSQATDSRKQVNKIDGEVNAKKSAKKSLVKNASKGESKGVVKETLKTAVKTATKKLSGKSPAKVVVGKDADIQKALALHHEGKLPEAWALYQEVLKQDPKHFLAVHHMGLIAIQKQSYKMAIDLFKIAATIEPHNPGVYNNMANAYLQLGKTDLALEYYNQALSLDAYHLDGLKNRAILFSSSQQYAKALADLALAIKRYPKALDLYATVASIYIAQGRHQEALVAYKKALALAPQNPILNNNYGVLLCALGQYLDAEICFTKAIKARDGYAEALNNRAVALVHLNRPAEAQADYERAITIYPGYADAMEGLGRLKASFY